MYLVYTRGFKGPVPEKWSELFVNTNGKPISSLAKHKLTEQEAALPFSVLSKMYPPPVMADD